MVFTPATLASTAGRFHKFLDAQGLSVSYQKDRDIWARIVVKKNYSGAISQAEAQGFISAVPVTTKSVQAELKQRSREMSHNLANQAFVEAIKSDLPELSYCMSMLIPVLCGNVDACLRPVGGGDRSGLGLIHSNVPGYMGLGTLPLFDGRAQEAAWIKASSCLVASLINILAGADHSFGRILGENCMESSQKSDEVFSAYMKPRVERFSVVLGQRIAAIFDADRMDEVCDFGVDFDEVGDIVYSVLENETFDERRRKGSWLNFECDRGQAMMDHLTVRLREHIKIACDPKEECEGEWDSYAQTAKICMWTSLHMKKKSSRTD